MTRQGAASAAASPSHTEWLSGYPCTATTTGPPSVPDSYTASEVPSDDVTRFCSSIIAFRAVRVTVSPSTLVGIVNLCELQFWERESWAPAWRGRWPVQVTR